MNYKTYFILVFILFTACITPSYCSWYDDGDDFIHLDLSDEKEKNKVVIKEKEIKTKKGKVSNQSKYVNSPQNEHNVLLFEDVDRLKPQKNSISKSIEKTVFNNTTIGTTYSTTEKSGKLNDAVSIYSKYEKEKFGLTTSYSQDRAGYKEQGLGGGTVSVAPEWKINDKIKLKNVYSENMSNNQKKGEFALSISPFNDDRMDFNVGASETFNNDNQGAKPQINFGTMFRF